MNPPSPSLSFISLPNGVPWVGNEGRQCRSTGQITGRSDTDSRDLHHVALSFSLILSLDSVRRVEVSFRNYFDFDDENFFRLKGENEISAWISRIMVEYRIRFVIRSYVLRKLNYIYKRGQCHEEIRAINGGGGGGETAARCARIIYPGEDRGERGRWLDLVRERYVIRDVVGRRSLPPAVRQRARKLRKHFSIPRNFTIDIFPTRGREKKRERETETTASPETFVHKSENYEPVPRSPLRPCNRPAICLPTRNGEITRRVNPS